MLNQMQIDRMLKKLKRFEECLEPYIFTKVGEVDFKAFVTDKQYHETPTTAFLSLSKKALHGRARTGTAGIRANTPSPRSLKANPYL